VKSEKRGRGMPCHEQNDLSNTNNKNQTHHVHFTHCHS
jgi:hypothetical protein